MSKYVFSTLTASQNYKGADGRKVRVEGGANSPTKHMHTPRGVATAITDEQAKILESSALFRKHRKSGFVEISAHRADPEKAAQALAGPDKSAPDTEDKLKADGKQAPAKGDGKK